MRPIYYTSFSEPNQKLIKRADRRARRVLSVMEAENLSTKETAERLNMTYSEVYNLLRRAKARGVC